MGDAEGAASPRDRWYCGPPTDRRAYVVDDIRAMRGGEGHVLRAERRTFPGDSVRYAGPVSLKICSEDVSAERVEPLRERWDRLAGIAWFVDDEGRRHWIATGGTWNCLGGDDAVAADDLPGWAVATLPLAGPARCP